MMEQATLQEEITNRAVDLLAEQYTATVAEDAVPWAVMNLLEDHFAETGHHVTVGYGDDGEMFADDSLPGKWWSRIPPVEGTRFRIFVPEDKPDEVTDVVSAFMAAIGATPVDESPGDTYDSYDHRGRTAMHYVLPDGSPIHRQVELIR